MSGQFPTSRSKSVLVPIHRKGSIHVPDNYRGITLTNVASKIYISVLTKRLTFYAEMFNCVDEAQGGFRRGYSTVDNAFVLQAFVSKYLCRKGKKLYVGFVDFCKAFDFVERSRLFNILIKHNIQGHLLESIKAIYS